MGSNQDPHQSTFSSILWKKLQQNIKLLRYICSLSVCFLFLCLLCCAFFLLGLYTISSYHFCGFLTLSLHLGCMRKCCPSVSSTPLQKNIDSSFKFGACFVHVPDTTSLRHLHNESRGTPCFMPSLTDGPVSSCGPHPPPASTFSVEIYAFNNPSLCCKSSHSNEAALGQVGVYNDSSPPHRHHQESWLQSETESISEVEKEEMQSASSFF